MEETQITPGDQQPGGNHATQQPPEATVVESTARPADQPPYYTKEEEQEEEDWDDHNEDGGLSTEFVSPFQRSDALPVVNSATAGTAVPGLPPAVGQPGPRRFPAMRVILVAIVVALVTSIFLMWVSAKPASPTHGNGSAVPTAASTKNVPSARPTPTPRTQQGKGPTPTPVATVTTGGTPQIPTDQTLGQLGWTAAGLTAADAFQAERTGWTFTEREETLVFNEPGTRTAATFLLTPGARDRFAQTDVRASSNAFWNTVTDPQRQLIQFALNLQPSLVKFATQGQQRFAWVDIAFWRWQSRIAPNDQAQRTSGMELDPATNQPRVHHMIVLLLRVAPQSQGANAPMGGTGWLVSNYTLDPAAGTLLDRVAPA
jgi:hypothetical protein